MKIVIFGSGLIGPAVAYNLMSDQEVSQVTICDLDQTKLDTALSQLSSIKGSDKVDSAVIDLTDKAASIKKISEYDVAVGALPRPAITCGILAATEAGVPWVDLLWPPDADKLELKKQVEDAGALVILGCGVEPGLSEMTARYLGEKMDQAHEVHIKCGGIPENPSPPLGYKIVYGGTELPLQADDARIIENGKIVPITRYSDTEIIEFSGVGECEAWHEGIFPWLVDLDVFKDLKLGTQKTIRWPGFAAKATMLRELGFLSHEPLEVDGAKIAPKRFLDALLYPSVKLAENEREITIFRVEVLGEKDNKPHRYCADMIDRYDDSLGFTSMARTTGFPGGIIARMVARGEISKRGYLTPEQVVTGSLYESLLAQLAQSGVKMQINLGEAD